MIQLPERIWEHAGRCGCGMCRFHRPAHGCPNYDAPGAIQMWRSRERTPEWPQKRLPEKLRIVK